MTALATPLALAACLPMDDATTATSASSSTPVIEVTRSVQPPDGLPDRCFARDDAPAEAALSPDPRGLPALWFEIPCGTQTDPTFIAAVQRALAARGLLDTEATGRLDAATRAAIADYQTPLRLRSEVLSLVAARQLGLVIWDPTAVDR